MREMVKKHKIALFLKNESTFKRIKKSETLTLSMNPTKTEHDYIADESPTTELDKYNPSIDQDLTIFKGEEDYEMIWPYFYEMKTGAEAHTDCMIVFMHEPVDESGNPAENPESIAGYKAWLTDSVISVQDMNAVDSKLNFKVLFGGTVKKGTATVVDGVPTFKEKSKN